MKLLLPLLLALPISSLAASAQDDYYSRDIFRAIDEARKNTHHYDYSSALRYNRSTSQSIQIPRLLNQEMAKTIVETPELTDVAAPVGNGTTLPADSLSGKPDTMRLQSSTPATITGTANSVTVTVR